MPLDQVLTKYRRTKDPDSYYDKRTTWFTRSDKKLKKSDNRGVRRPEPDDYDGEEDSRTKKNTDNQSVDTYEKGEGPSSPGSDDSSGILATNTSIIVLAIAMFAFFIVVLIIVIIIVKVYSSYTRRVNEMDAIITRERILPEIDRKFLEKEMMEERILPRRGKRPREDSQARPSP